MLNLNNFFKSELEVIEQALELLKPQDCTLLYFDANKLEYAVLSNSQHYISNPELDVSDLAVSHIGYYSKGSDFLMDYKGIAEALIKDLHELDCR
ncbi:hypothetical protein [Pseudoalteromonas denitrificans]|uniref:Uncharacterized protein n=1 Tax=Pseudoalteromonas denitrificans DSM 6059 TaxID=1123010 RepID=A0A1I1GJG6_9GAMM|nr:hypothetical protein [Pseudoalteromonas denitrificans]SFC09300.1 hypothetical protein SAMN02745724_00904 [Pseudoalteromonas denitrificans DSM 6059]